MPICEIIYLKSAKGWKWRVLSARGDAKPRTSQETFELFYDCVSAARAKGYQPNVKYL